MPATILTLADRRVPLRTLRRLPKPLRAQLAWILEREGAGSVTAASKDPEWRDGLEVVDVRDAGGATRYQLWLWPSGSAALFRDATTDRVGEAVQHTLTLEPDDEPLRAALAKALAGAGALGISERIAVGAPRRGSARRRRPERGPDGASPAGLAARLAELRAIPRKQQGARMAVAERLVTELFGEPWNPYPKRRPGSLTADQRQLLEALLELELLADTKHVGLPERDEQVARLLGRAPAGPSDVEVRVRGAPTPLWCAVSDVGSGDLEPGPVLDAFRALPAATALAAWVELARGDAYDVAEVHPRKMSEAGLSRTPNQVRHRTRLFGWMADACLHLGEPGRAAAARLAGSLPTWDWGHPAFVALLSLSRHARACKEVLAPRYDALLARLRGPEATVFAEPVLAEILRGLPEERAAALRG